MNIHPRLFIKGKEHLDLVRSRVNKHPFDKIYNKLKNKVISSNDLTRDYVISLAILYLIENDDNIAKAARNHIEDLGLDVYDPEFHRGLSTYSAAMRICVIYDIFADAPSWQGGFRKIISRRIHTLGTYIFENGGRGQNKNNASNWQARRWSSAGMCFIATDEAAEFDDLRIMYCFMRVKKFLRDNAGKDGVGTVKEGYSYGYFSWAALGQFAIAARLNFNYDVNEANNKSIQDSLAALLNPVVMCMTGDIAEIIKPDISNDSIGSPQYGVMSMAFAYADQTMMPGFKWIYNRLVGELGNQTWDVSIRPIGLLFSLLYYPSDVEEKNPLEISKWRETFFDEKENGVFVFRNDFKDSQDSIVHFFGKYNRYKINSGFDLNSIRAIAYNTPWIIGGGKGRVKVAGAPISVRQMTSVYSFDPSTNNMLVPTSGGKHVAHEISQSGPITGFAESMVLANEGNVKNFTRRVDVEYTDNQTLILLRDSSQNGLFWQLCTMPYMQITIEPTGFLIKDPYSDASLKGKVLTPETPLKVSKYKQKMSKGFRFRGQKIKSTNNILVESDTPEFIVALTISAIGVHPDANIIGEKVKIGRFEFPL